MVTHLTILLTKKGFVELENIISDTLIFLLVWYSLKLTVGVQGTTKNILYMTIPRIIVPKKITSKSWSLLNFLIRQLQISTAIMRLLDLIHLAHAWNDRMLEYRNIG
jgi:hypothetical protein